MRPVPSDSRASGRETRSPAPACGGFSPLLAWRRLSPRDRSDWLCLFLGLVALLIYLPVLSFDFLYYDDPGYVTQNSHVSSGLSLKNAIWALGALHGGVSYWHPLTWVSHQLDCTLFGLNSGAHHFTNVLFHAGAGALLFVFLGRATGRLELSAMVAALFLLHPLHVESVAWISERKDVLSAVCWMATLWAYASYARAPGGWRYGRVAGCFCLGLMAKPSVVTLPVILLVLDFWPLNRWNAPGDGRRLGRHRLLLMVEKLPLLVLSLAVSLVTFVGQRELGATVSAQLHPLSDRIDNALVTYVLYLGKTLWPVNLAPYYIRTTQWPFAGVLAAGVLLGLLSVAAWRLRRRAPYLLAGWLWFLVVLLPMIGLIQVGSQYMADRYTYLPLIGVFIMLAWGGADLLARVKSETMRLALGGAVTVMILAALTVLTHRQLPVWQDTARLCAHAVLATPDNFIAERHLGKALGNLQRYEEADRHFARAARLVPQSAETQEEWGLVRFKAGRWDLAIPCFRAALERDPPRVVSHFCLGRIYASAPDAQLRDGKLALEHARFVCQASPDAEAKNLDLLAAAYAEDGQFSAAVEAARRAGALAQAAGCGDEEFRERLALYERQQPFRATLPQRSLKPASISPIPSKGTLP